MGLFRAAADAPAKLVELGESEALGVFDDHHGGVGHVDADFDDGCRDEDLRFVFAEALHDFVFFLAREPPVQQAELQFWKNLSRQPFVLLHRRFQLELRFFDHRIDDVGLMPGGNFAAQKFPDAGEMRLRGHARGDRRAARRQLVENGNVQVAIERERERARNRRRRQHQDVRRVAVGRGFVHQPLALQNAEAVLLINGHKAEPREFHIVFDQRVRADDQLRFAGANAFEGRGFSRRSSSR